MPEAMKGKAEIQHLTVALDPALRTCQMACDADGFAVYIGGRPMIR